MKKKWILIPLAVVLAIVLLALGVWGVSLLRCELLTDKHLPALTEAGVIENLENQAGELAVVKVLNRDDDSCTIYCVTDKLPRGNKILFEKQGESWVAVEWTVVWSYDGVAKNYVLPYWWHTLRGVL